MYLVFKQISINSLKKTNASNTEGVCIFLIINDANDNIFENYNEKKTQHNTNVGPNKYYETQK